MQGPLIKISKNLIFLVQNAHILHRRFHPKNLKGLLGPIDIPKLNRGLAVFRSNFCLHSHITNQTLTLHLPVPEQKNQAGQNQSCYRRPHNDADEFAPDSPAEMILPCGCCISIRTGLHFLFHSFLSPVSLVEPASAVAN